MGFDDLAKRMAERDKKLLGPVPTNPIQFLVDVSAEQRRTSRTRDLVLGSLLLVGGAVILILYVLYLLDATDPSPRPGEPPRSNYFVYSIGLTVVAAGMVITGLLQVVRGLKPPHAT